MSLKNQAVRATLARLVTYKELSSAELLHLLHLLFKSGYNSGYNACKRAHGIKAPSELARAEQQRVLPLRGK